VASRWQSIRQARDRSTLAKFAQAIAERKTDQLRAELAQLLERPEVPAELKALIPTLQGILDGSRDGAVKQLEQQLG